MLNPFMNSQMQFKQKKFMILPKFILSDSDEKIQNLDNA
jgi:hypothetical protein